MSTRRELIEAEDFERRRAVAALFHADTLETDEVPPRPTGRVLGGIVLVVLLCAATAAAAFLTDRAPSGWMADGSLVVDEETGARYVAQAGRLRPAPTVTAALLAGARRTPVLVSSERVARAPAGLPLVGLGLPERPPALPVVPTGFTACVSGQDRVDVFAGEPAALPSRAGGVLVRPVGGTDLVLATGRAGFPVPAEGATALGYTLAEVREVPAAWLATLPVGPALDLIRPTRAGRGLPGVGASGDVVASAGSGGRFVVDDGTLRPLANRTSELLAPAPERVLPDAALAAAPAGLPAGIVDAPSTPPPLPTRETRVVPCLRSSDGAVSVARLVGDAGTQAGPTRLLATGGAPVVVTWHFPPGQGALVGPPDVDRPRTSSSDAAGGGVEGVAVVSEGAGYPVADTEALRALDYRRDQVVLLPSPWLALLERGPTLRRTG